MIDVQQIQQEINKLKEQEKELNFIINIEDLNQKINELKKLEQEENYFQDREKVKEVFQKLKNLTNKKEHIEELKKTMDFLPLSLEFYQEGDISIEDEIKENIKIAKNIIEKLELEILLNSKYDDSNAFITLHAGAGGTESQDWVEMLYRMYLRYSEKNKFKIEEIDKLDGDVAGIKSITFKVSGNFAYGYLKAEKGVHRLVRISPFDSKGKRHTSFASVDVFPELEDTKEIEIKQEDLKIDTYRSSGAGGQHVNKTESAVRITHIPSSIIVQCQNERSQIQNREKAMKMLISKLIELKEEEKQKENKEIQGSLKKIEWGSQIRSYVFCPYTMVKDHRTDFENTNIQSVMDGNIDNFIKAYLKGINQ